MYTLIIDSATKVLYHALVKDDVVVDEYYTKGQNDHAKNIVNIIDIMLKKENITIDDINNVVCGIGPGSYTGERMAVTVAKMLGVFKNIKVYEVSTLALISTGEKGRVLSMIDSRRGNAFSAIYENGKLVVDEKIRNIKEFSEEKHDSVATESEYKVDPLLGIKIAKFNDKPNGLVPNYLQKTEAERNLEQKNANKKNG